jgi:hypothetical protein
MSAQMDVSGWVADQAQLSLTRWVVTSAVWNLGQVVGLLGHGMTPNLDGHWFHQMYGLMIGMAATLTPLFLLLAALQALARQDPAVLGRAAVNLAVAFIAAALAVPLVALLLQVTDNLSDYVVSTELDNLNHFVDQVSLSLGQDLGGGGTPGETTIPLFMVFCSATVVCFGCLLIWLELLVRDVATYVAVLFFPLLLAVAVWPKAMQLVRQLVEVLVAVILSKFAIVVVIAAGAGALLDVFQRHDPSLLLVGGAILLLAAYAPYRLLRVLPALEVAAVHVFDGGGRHSLTGLQVGAWRAYSIGREFSRVGPAPAAPPAASAAAGAHAPGTALVAALAMAAARRASQAGDTTVGSQT